MPGSPVRGAPERPRGDGLPRAVVGVVLALAGAGAQAFGQGRTGGLQLGVLGQRLGAVPQFEQREFVGVLDALEQLEMLAAGVLARLLAARLESTREFGAFA